MNQELRPEIGRTAEEAQLAINAANHQLGIRKAEVASKGGELTRDGGVNFRLGQIDALRWMLATRGTMLEDTVDLYVMIHGMSGIETKIEGTTNG